MRTRLVLLALSVLAAASAAPAAAQTPPLLLDVRAGAAAPVGEDTERTKLGYGLGGGLSVGVLDALALYVGYDYVQFEAQGTADLIDDASERTELNLGRIGARALLFPSHSRVDVFLEGGALLSDGGELGGEGGIGVVYLLRRERSLALTPRIAYRRVDDIDWASFALGFQVRP